jgi:uncharacterized protein involved in type VI secretion and phage assembly
VPAFETHSPLPDVKVGGPLPPGVGDKLRRVVVEAQRNLPAMCEVEFADAEFTVIDHPMLRPGAPLTVAAASASDDPTQLSTGPIFDGEIVALEASFTPGSGSRLVVRGYDKSHRLHRTRRTRTFLRQSDNVIVTGIASDYGLAPRVDPTGGPHEYLCQRNQTDWEFVCERAREIGFEVGVDKGALVFRKAGQDPLAGLAQRLDHGDNLLSFRLRVTSAEQAQSITVRSWDPLLKDELTVPAPPPVGENAPRDPGLLPSMVAAQFGSTEDVVADHPFGLPQAETALSHATARREHVTSAYFEAEGLCTGNPAMVPGGQVSVNELGTRFSGKYTLTSVRHVFDQDGFATAFTISGTNDRSLFGLTQPGAALRSNGHSGAAILAGAVVGTVTNTNDEHQSGRVKVKFPWLGDSAESHWAPIVSVGAGPGKGLQVIPEVGDQVLVVFELGDVRRPYVLGGVYGPPTELPEPQHTAVLEGKTNIRVLKTRTGHVLRFDDTTGHESITLETHRGSSVVIQEGPTNKIALVDSSGKNSVTIDGSASTISVTSGMDVEITAAGQLKLKGTRGVEIESSGPVSVKSSASLELEGAATAALKGQLVTIN